MKDKYFEPKKFVKNYIYAITIFIITLTIGISIFFNVVQSSVEKNSRETLITNVTQQSEHLNTILNINYSYLNVLAKELSKSKDLFSEDNISLIKAFMENTDLNRTAIIDSDGNALYDNNVVKNVAHRRYFKESMQGKQSLSDPLESSVDQQTRVILCVPIYKNNQVIGVVGGSYNVTKLGNMLFDDLFEGQGKSFIVDQDGNLITRDKKYEKKHNIKTIDNLFDICDEKEVKTDFNQQESDLIQIQTEKNKSLYLAYSPLKINDWMICYIVPVHVAQESYTFITHYETLLATFLGLIVLSLMIYLAHSNSRENKYLIHLSEIDPLTSVYNKETTQKLIDQKIKQNEHFCFLILDVDEFKSVNDNYGHAVGDIVLKKLGNLFKNHFRQTDIVGRIGGDEFIILIQDENIAESRIQSLLQKVNELKIEELKDFKLSISIGIAFAPKDGTTFMELYRHADHALYQTKRAGKNNYKIYKNDEN
ncbi:sensor domain-containing diguanylate cyclase [uncultured Holdemanella sp.]|uniref:sensor domain-containing diguanylate cyclase n=1 Tax=uncultured Holdemanella sp. TaxID=1763549 RepID=UPI0025DB4A02|nr:sensor domain-containing diguanylate cyclase [uncultured Holdemanella sp.]